VAWSLESRASERRVPSTVIDMRILEIENAIPPLYQDQVELEATSNDIPWYFHRETARAGAGFGAQHSGFSHLAYHYREPVSSGMGPSLIPMLFMFCDKAKLSLKTILRIRVGLFLKGSGDVLHHNPHVDFLEPHYTAVYYVSDTDGDTFIFNETFEQVPQAEAARHAAQRGFSIAQRSTPKKGKMICFDGRHYHASMHPTVSSARIAITFNFQ
jgi:hypothetical protein